MEGRDVYKIQSCGHKELGYWRYFFSQDPQQVLAISYIDSKNLHLHEHPRNHFSNLRRKFSKIA